MTLIYCDNCKLILGWIEMDAESEETLCEKCMEKKYGKAYMDNATREAEDFDEDEQLY